MYTITINCTRLGNSKLDFMEIFLFLRRFKYVMANKAESKRIYFPHLDVARFVAAFMIVIYHGYEAWVGWYGEIGFLSSGTYETLSPFGQLVDRFLRNFEIGVDVFFLLSGFLITYILLEEKKKFKKIHIWNFIVRRTLRIWPLYFLLIAAAPFLVSWLDTDSPNYLANALFVNNFYAIKHQIWEFPFAHFWSICIEEHFYLAWPFVIAFVPRKHLLKVFAGMIALSAVFRIYLTYTMAEPWFSIYLHTISRMDVIIIGAVGGYFYSREPFHFRLHTMYRLGLWIILIAALAIEPAVHWDSAFLAGFKKYFYTAVIAVLLLDYNFNDRYRHVFGKNSVFHYLGKVSYGIYMYGNILLLIVMKKIIYGKGIDNLYLYFILLIGASLLVPVVSYELIERPVLKLKKRFARIQTRR